MAKEKEKIKLTENVGNRFQGVAKRSRQKFNDVGLDLLQESLDKKRRKSEE